MNVCGALRSVSTAKKASTIAVAAIADEHDRGVRARLRAPPVGGDADEQEDHQRARAADGGDRREVDEVATTSTIAAVISIPACGPSREPRPKNGRELPAPGEHRRQAAGRVEGRVHGRRGREQGGDRHHREAGVPERRPRGLGDRRLAVADHLRDRERAEHAERDQDVQHRGHAERDVHRLAAARARGRAGRRRRT